jgi:hypothetical protein
VKKVPQVRQRRSSKPFFVPAARLRAARQPGHSRASWLVTEP